MRRWWLRFWCRVDPARDEARRARHIAGERAYLLIMQRHYEQQARAMMDIAWAQCEADMRHAEWLREFHERTKGAPILFLKRKGSSP